MTSKIRSAKGFTLIELMIVVAIIGILAAIAIPNFLRYQLRAKFGELPTNVNAIFKSEESLRQSERVVNGVSGQYQAVAKLPSGCVVAANAGTTKQAWIVADVTAAGAIDWMVEGSTYGCYQASSTSGNDLQIGAVSNIDGDADIACVALVKDGVAPTVTAATGVTGCTGAAATEVPANSATGTVVRVTADNIF